MITFIFLNCASHQEHEEIMLIISDSYRLFLVAFVFVVVKALRYKPADRGFDSRLCYWNFSVT
jgi:hypothetical protein